MGIGAIALHDLLGGRAAAAAPAAGNALEQKLAAIAPKAKAVIYLHMAGSPSQLDLFDYKPALVPLNGKDCPDEFLKGKRFAFIKGVPKMLASPFKWAQHGPNGVWLSEVWKYLPQVLGDVAIVKSMNTEQFNHAPAQLLLHTGTQLLGGASLGAWATYGLGSESQDLPGFVVLTSAARRPMPASACGAVASFPASTRASSAAPTAIRSCFFPIRRGLAATAVGRRWTHSASSTTCRSNPSATPKPSPVFHSMSWPTECR